MLTNKGASHGLRRRLLWAFGAQSSLVAVRAAQQLLTVPILIWGWGIETYHDWIIIFNATNFLSVLDLGMQLYFGNVFLFAWSSKDYGTYRRSIGIAFWFYGCIITLCIIALGLTLKFVPWQALLSVQTLDNNSFNWTVGILAIATLILLPSAIPTALYRAKGDYGSSIAISTIGEMLRGVGLCVAVIVGATPPVAATVYFGVALSLWIFLGVNQYRRYGEFPIRMEFPNWLETTEVVRKSSLYFTHTIITPIITNVPVLILASVAAAPTIVVAFSISRTLCGFIRQLVLQINLPVGMEMAQLLSQGHDALLRKVFLTIARISAGISGLLVGLTMVLSGPLITLWTRGHVAYDSMLIIWLLFPIILVAPAQAAYNIFTFTNMPRALALANTLYAISAIFLSAVLTRYFLSVGTAVGLGVSEICAIGILLPVVACRHLSISAMTYFRVSLFIAAASYFLGYIVAWALIAIIGNIDILKVFVVGLLWTTILAVPALYIIPPSDVRRDLLTRLISRLSAWR